MFTRIVLATAIAGAAVMAWIYRSKPVELPVPKTAPPMSVVGLVPLVEVSDDSVVDAHFKADKPEETLRTPGPIHDAPDSEWWEENEDWLRAWGYDTEGHSP